MGVAVQGTWAAILARISFQAFDLSLYREFPIPIHEGIRLRFQADMFTVLNTPQFSPESAFRPQSSLFGFPAQMATMAWEQESPAQASPDLQSGGPRQFPIGDK